MRSVKGSAVDVAGLSCGSLKYLLPFRFLINCLLIRRLNYGCVSRVGRQEHVYVHVSTEDVSGSAAKGTVGCPEAAT